MQIPLQISYRDVRKSKGIESAIQKKVDKLEEICDSITSCRVAIEKPQKHQHIGNPFRVRVYLNVPPNKEIIVRRESSDGDMHEKLITVVRSAFDAARRQLQKVVQKKRSEVKIHYNNEVNGIIQKIFTDDGYGFIKGFDGSDIYFHQNSVLHNNFNHLEIGAGVRFIREEGDDGPQASSVQVIDKSAENVIQR